MGFLVFAGKKLAAIGCFIGGVLFGFAFFVGGILGAGGAMVGVGIVVFLMGIIAGFYLWRRADREVGFKIT